MKGLLATCVGVLSMWASITFADEKQIWLDQGKLEELRDLRRESLNSLINNKPTAEYEKFLSSTRGKELLDSQWKTPEDTLNQIDINNNNSIKNTGTMFRAPDFGWSDHTIDPMIGGAAVDEYLENKISEEEKRKRMNEISRCTGYLKDLSNESIGCFDSLLATGGIANKNYNKAINLVSSLVDSSYRHLCVVSYISEGIWITAAHCIDKQGIAVGRMIFVNYDFKSIAIEDVTFCKVKGCDIAIIKAETPYIPPADRPKIVYNAQDIRWTDHILIPGVPLSTSIYDATDHQAYLNLIKWNPVDHGFCMIIDKAPNGCLIHACSTLTGFSGAPVYRITNSGTELVAIHSGSEKSENQCESDLTINYARLIPEGSLMK